MPSHFLSTLLARLRDGGPGPAFMLRDRALSYPACYELLLRMHAALADVTPEHTVAIAGGNRPETVLAQIAAQLRGAAVLYLSSSATDAARLSALRAAKASVLIIDPDTGPEGTLARQADITRVYTLDELAAHHAARPPPGAASAEPALPESVTAVFPTGGTTGEPKLVTHRGIYDGMAHIFAPHPDGQQRILLVAPMSHLAGNCAVLGALLCGDTVVPHAGFDATAVLRSIEADAITTLTLTPPRLSAVLENDSLPHTDVSSVRSLSIGAAPLPAHRMAQALELFGPVVGQGYGLTEAPMVASISAAELVADPGLLGSVGTTVPGMEAMVDERSGEVLVRGIALMGGYYARADLTEAAFEDGWLRTGDIGHFDGAGYLYLHGRADEVVVTGEHGSKVHPGIVEKALNEHGAVADSAVFGVPDAQGWQLHAAVVPRHSGVLSAADVRAHVRTRLGREHLVPASVEFHDAFPLTAIGKVDKSALRSQVSSPDH